MNPKGTSIDKCRNLFLTKKRKLITALDLFINESIKQYRKEFCASFGLTINDEDAFKFGLLSGARNDNNESTTIVHGDVPVTIKNWKNCIEKCHLQFYNYVDMDNMIDLLNNTEESSLIRICMILLNDPDIKGFVDGNFRVILHRNCQLKIYIANIYRTLAVDFNDLNSCINRINIVSQQEGNGGIDYSINDTKNKRVNLQILALIEKISKKLRALSELYGARQALLEDFGSKLSKQKIKLTRGEHDIDEEIRSIALHAGYNVAIDMEEENEVYKLFSKYNILKNKAESDYDDDIMDMDDEAEDSYNSSNYNMEYESGDAMSVIKSPEFSIDTSQPDNLSISTPLTSPKVVNKTPQPIPQAPQLTNSIKGSKTVGKTKKIVTKIEDGSDTDGSGKQYVSKGKTLKSNIGLDLATLAEMNAAPDEPRYCLCDRVSYGDMVGCDNEKCSLEWFHFECVGLRHKPKGKWYCPLCRGDKSTTLKKPKVK
uniref:PHD-type domain-containing protein n=1 Tax=Parastrongyloides trichosuri TaxID=131310 RepID=A0A0N5A2T5_PARTI